jgi:hypothetical protein
MVLHRLFNAFRFPIMKAMALRNKSEEDGIVLHK